VAPNWAGHKILNYFTDERIFLDDNLKAIRTFPETIFLPGFWSEYGMCTEPSAFGSVSMWAKMSSRLLKRCCIRPTMSSIWRSPIRASMDCCPCNQAAPAPAAGDRESRTQDPLRGGSRPLNIASFLMGTPEFLEAIKTDPELMHRLLDIVTNFLVDWIAYQREVFPSIDGIFLLDDIVGFVSPATVRSSLCPISSGRLRRT